MTRDAHFSTSELLKFAFKFLDPHFKLTPRFGTTTLCP
jgi:hypothetical protein